MPPALPPPVKAAAILLIVVGLDLLLTGMASVVVVFVVALLHAIPAWDYSLLPLAPLLLGAAVLKMGLAVWSGRVQRLRNYAVFCTGLGTAGTWFAVTALWWGFTDGMYDRRALLGVRGLILAANVLLLSHSVAGLIAGLLLLANRRRYAEWRTSARSEKGVES